MIVPAESMWKEEMETVFPNWAVGTTIVVGLVVAIVAFIVGWLLIHRRRARLRELAARSGEWKDKTSPEEAFRYGMGMARRKSVRLSGNQIPVLVTTDTNTDSPWEGWIVNRSEGGLRLTVAQQVPVGTALRVRALHSRKTLPWAEVEVKNARQQPEHWELGCQFVSSPPPEVLESFGSL